MKKLLFILIIFSGACKEAYIPPVHSTNNTYLVVDGFINNGLDSTYITLSHTFKLDDTSRVIPELHAQLTVEGKDNSSYPLKEFGGGQYGATSLTLNNALQYRLHIRTSAGKEYVSDYMDLKPSPPIDSVSWKRTPGGLQIYANTHDPQSASHYYRWDYQETWEFHSEYYALLQFVNHQILPLGPNPYYTCWKYNLSPNILVTSSTKLSSDVISEAPLELIPPGSWQIGIRYSMLVKQYVLSADAYNFWLNMQKNTEQIGSIFSPQPSEIQGNIHALADSSEQVIGFISAGTLQKMRIFITPDQIPDWKLVDHFNCSEHSTSPDSVEYFFNHGDLLVDFSLGGTSLRYDMSDDACVDCTFTGTNKKPSYWP